MKAASPFNISYFPGNTAADKQEAKTNYLLLFVSIINQLDAQKFCFTISLEFHASTCFEHMCSKHVEA